MTENLIGKLRHQLGEIADIKSAIALLQWDQEVYMPPKGAEGRGHQLATLSALAHRMFTDPAVGDLLENLGNAQHQLDYADARLVDVAKFDYSQATRLPESFVHELARECSAAYEVWVKARKNSDFAHFQPNLQKIVDLNRRKADLLGFKDSPYDALLEEYERGMTTAQLKSIFGDLAVKQSALVARILASPKQPKTPWLTGEWDATAQWNFSLELARDVGYDFDAGRQDKSVHPFSTQFDLYDARITTRISATDPFSILTGSLHETGHALYMQGHDPADRRTPLLEGASLGMHESQSRMWENLIGRSLAFWNRYTPRMREHFPEKLKGVTPHDIYAALNRVARSLIRVEADECTYNLHIILRFEIEVGLIEGTLNVADVPEIWNAKMKKYLNLDVPDAAHGCLQDIHWSHGAFGYFPTYALGNLYAAQLFEALRKAISDIETKIEAGGFAPILAWLRENVHRHGRRKLATEILRDATGADPSSTPYLHYLESKYGTLYSL